MRKLFFAIVGLIVLLIAVWLGASWFVGQQTEKQVRQYLDNTAGQHVLVDYRRSLFSASATTRLNVSQTLLGQWVDELQLLHEISHGPLYWRASEPTPGLSFWQSRLDQSVLDDSVKQLITEAFSAQQPFRAALEVDFNQTAQYWFELAPLNTENIANPTGELTLVLDDLKLSGLQRLTAAPGSVDSANSTDPLPGSPANLIAADSPSVVIADGFQISTGQLEVSNGQASIALPELILDKTVSASAYEFTLAADEVAVTFAGAAEPVRFAMAAVADIADHETELQGRTELTLNQFSGVSYPLEKLDFKLDFSGIDKSALTEINRLQNRMQDIQAQLQSGWGEEEMDLPETRRRMTQLDIELREVANQLLAVLLKGALRAGKTRLDYDLSVTTPQGVAQSNAKLSYAGTDKTIVLDDLVTDGLAVLMRLVRGDITLQVAEELLPAELSALLAYPLQAKGLVQTDSGYRLDLRLLADDLELNGRVVEHNALWDKFMPPLPTANSDHDVPEDVWVMIEQQGLSEELLRELAQREDISAATLQMLRQLQKAARIMQE